MKAAVLLAAIALALVGCGPHSARCTATIVDLIPYTGPTCKAHAGCECKMDPESCDVTEVCPGDAQPDEPGEEP